jgi:hypothetical protein
MNWFRLKEKIKFYRQAKTAHGLHSPFVFNFYNKVKKQAKSRSLFSKNLKGFNKKENRIILAIIQYLKPTHTLVLSNEEQIINNWSSFLMNESQVFFAQGLNTLPLKPTNFDLIIFSKLLIVNQKEFIDKLLPLISNDSAVIIPHIHASKTAINQWKTLIEEKSVRVSLDLFFIGVFFFRKESTKQDFQLQF